MLPNNFFPLPTYCALQYACKIGPYLFGIPFWYNVYLTSKSRFLHISGVHCSVITTFAAYKLRALHVLYQRSVWPETQSVESTLYPDVLKIKTIIVVKQNFAKMPFVYYLQITHPCIWIQCRFDRLCLPSNRCLGWDTFQHPFRHKIS